MQKHTSPVRSEFRAGVSASEFDENPDSISCKVAASAPKVPWVRSQETQAPSA